MIEYPSWHRIGPIWEATAFFITFLGLQSPMLPSGGDVRLVPMLTSRPPDFIE